VSDEIQTPEVTPDSNAIPAPADNAAERRIAELTAQRHEMERQYSARFEEQSKQVAELIAAVGRMQTTPSAPVEAAPAFEIDPEEQRKLEYIANKIYGPKFAQLQAQQQQHYQQQMSVAFQQHAVREQSKEVTDEAQKLWNHWQQTGKQGFVIADAFTYARGLVLERQHAAKGAEQRFGGGDPSATVITGNPAPPPLQPPGRGLPKNYDSLPFDEQERIFLATYGDEPL
jgi:hypothetical protein